MDFLATQSEQIIRISIILLIVLTLYLLYQVCKHLHINIHLIDIMNKKNSFLLITILSLPIILLLSLVISTFFFHTLSLPIMIISIVILVIYFFTNLYIIKMVHQLYITKKKLEETHLYNESLIVLHDNIRGFKHDFSNIVQAIGGYITSNDMNGLKTYYYQLLDDCQKVNNLCALSPKVINNPAVYSILTSKYNKADELGITVNLDVFINLNELNMKIYEFSRILGILFDNAIEAARECEEKIINIEIRRDSLRNRQLLMIENTYSEKNIDLENIFKKGISSKPNNTGLGLWEVRQILKKHHNLNLFTNKDNKFFKQQLEMYPNLKR